MHTLKSYVNGYTAIKLLLVFMLFNSNSSAQISVQLQPVLPIQLRITDMWKGTILNNSGTDMSVVLKGSVSLSNTTLVVEGITEQINLKPGVNVIQPGLVPIRNYRFNPDVQLAGLSSTELFPFGSYIVCLKVFSLSNTELGASCMEANIKPLSPPMLLSPWDASEVHTPFPLFVWSPPVPVPVGMQVQYDFRLVELLSGQKPADAIQRNFAIVEQNGIGTNMLQYPVNAVRLEPFKEYVWQVIAKGDNVLIGSTEIWRFVLSKDTVNIWNEVKPNQYYEPKSTLDGAFAVAVEVLGLILKEQKDLKIQLYNSKHERLKIEPELKQISNDSRYIINWKETGKLKNGQIYLLEFLASDGTKSYVLFKYFSSIKKYNNPSAQ